MERVYPGKIEKFRQLAREMGERGISTQAVADVVREALTARKPKARYLVGKDARQMVMAQRLLPTRRFDALVKRETGL
jgi:hypothetical protein